MNLEKPSLTLCHLSGALRTIMRFLVLVNETFSGFFQSSRGLKQGDPLYPYLLVLAMEGLSYFAEEGKGGRLHFEV